MELLGDLHLSANVRCRLIEIQGEHQLEIRGAVDVPSYLHGLYLGIMGALNSSEAIVEPEADLQGDEENDNPAGRRKRCPGNRSSQISTSVQSGGARTWFHRRTGRSPLLCQRGLIEQGQIGPDQDQQVESGVPGLTGAPVAEHNPALRDHPVDEQSETYECGTDGTSALILTASELGSN